MLNQRGFRWSRQELGPGSPDWWITLSGLQALAELEYPDKLQKLLLTPQREVLVELVVTKDNGEVQLLLGSLA